MVLTEKGFARPTFDELLERQINRARQLFGEDIETGGQSVLGKYIRINVYDLAECYELLEDIYYARFPNTARGQSLDRLCSFTGVVRDAATASKIRVRFKGNAGAVIGAGFLVSGGGAAFYADNVYTVGAGGTCEAWMNCTKPGAAGNIPRDTGLTIVNPDPDLEGVSLLQVETYGQEKENDTSLRIRFNESVAGSGSATADAIRGAITRVPLVDGAAVVENDTEDTVDGRPPHSFECYVLAPESQDKLIAEAIFAKKPIGIKSIGEVGVQVLDKGNKAHGIRFSRTRKKNIHIRMTVLTDRFFESDGIGQIQDNLMEFINNLANGESVYLSGLYGYIHSVHGVVNVQNIGLSEDGINFDAASVTIGEYEIARTGAEQIKIEVTM